jgi:hypothetical protein
MLCEPELRVEIGKIALPLEIFAVPSTAVPSMNVTAPVDVAVDDVTVAVNLTSWPCFDGFREEVNVVVVVA